VSHVAVVNATYALPFGQGKRFLGGLGRFGNAAVGGWMVNSIVTLQDGFPFSPQLSYNPSNNGDTRNPVRPFANPAFSGPVILGNPSQWFNPHAFSGAGKTLLPTAVLRKRGERYVDWTGLGRMGFSVLKRHSDSRKIESSISGGDIQPS